MQYHGAEHKVIHCFEHQQAMEPAIAREFSTRHPRCGTSFILTVMIISIVLFSFLVGRRQFSGLSFGWPASLGSGALYR